MIDSRLVHSVYNRYSHHKSTNKQKNATCVGMIGQISVGKMGQYNYLLGSVCGVFQAKYCWIAGAANYNNIDDVYFQTSEPSINPKAPPKSYWKWFKTSTKEPVHPAFWPLSQHVTLLAHGRFHFLQNLVDGEINPIAIELSRKLLSDPNYTKEELDFRAAWYSYFPRATSEFYAIESNKKLLTDEDGIILPLHDVKKLLDQQLFVLQETYTPSQILVGAHCKKTGEDKVLSITCCI